MFRPLAVFLFAMHGWVLVFAEGNEHRGAIPINSVNAATNYLGVWIWDQVTEDKQTCHFWKRIDIPQKNEVQRAQLRLAADNVFTAYLDGREIGRGGDWRTLSAYDVTFLLTPGPHILGVEGFNDVDKAGLIVGLHIELSDGSCINVQSDTNWLVAPLDAKDWLTSKRAMDNWSKARKVGRLGQAPWWVRPTSYVNIPPIFPMEIPLWEKRWFQISLVAVCGLAALLCGWLMTQLAVQSRARRLLQLERARIARDIHDDLGARVTQLLLTGEEAQGHLPNNSETGAQFNQICESARDVLTAIDEVVWIVNSQRDTLNESIIYVCKYAESFLRAAAVRCRFEIQRNLPDISLDLPFRRHLLLTVKESLSNAVKHAKATEVLIYMRLQGSVLFVAVEDNGGGFAPAQVPGGRHGLDNMITRIKELGGNCAIESEPGQGCRVEFSIPLPSVRARPWPFNSLLFSAGINREIRPAIK